MEDGLTEDVPLQEGVCPTIAEHATQCNSLFQRKMDITDIVPDPTIMNEQLARFILSADNMGVYGPLNASLDYRLRYSPTVKMNFHQPLDIICETLDSLQPVVKQRPPSPRRTRKKQRMGESKDSEVARRMNYYDSSSSDSELDQAEENISKITKTISNPVRKSAEVDRARKIKRDIGDKQLNNATAELGLYTERYIRFRFPEAPDLLRAALVKANELRLRRLCNQQSHQRHIDLGIQNLQLTEAVCPKLPNIKEAPGQTVSFAAGVFQKPARVNKPSGPADSVPAPATAQVPRAKSIAVNNKPLFHPVPSSPECPYCGVIIEFKSGSRTTLWQNHVIGDLEPFFCVFPHCLNGKDETAAPPTFGTSEAWISHMQNAHGHAWECRAPSHAPVIFNEEIHHQEHSIREHGVPETFAGILSSAAQRPILDKMLQCPFNDDFQPPEKVEPSPVFASEALQSHIANHMIEIALLTLQKLPSDEDEYDMNFRSTRGVLGDNGRVVSQDDD